MILFNVAPSSIEGFPEIEWSDFQKLMEVYNNHSANNEEKQRYFVITSAGSWEKTTKKLRFFPVSGNRLF